MSKKNYLFTLMAICAMSVTSPALSQEEKSFSPKIKTQDTSADLVDSTPEVAAPVKKQQAPAVEKEYHTSSAPRRLQRHGLGIGLGQTFLLGDYSKHGNSKITADLLYSYAASYSFDFLANLHFSSHKDEGDKMKVMGLTGAIKARMFEYDNFSPYILGGLGFYAPEARRHTAGKMQWSSQRVTFGVNFGAGVDLRLNEDWVIGVLGQLHAPFAVEQEGQRDVRGYYFKLMFTTMYLF